MSSKRLCSFFFCLVVGWVFSCLPVSVSAQDVQIGDKVEFERKGRKVVGEIKADRGGGRIFSISYQDGPRTETIVLPKTRFKVIGSSPKKSTTNNSPKTGSGTTGSGTTGSDSTGNSAPATMRLWTDKTGNFKVKAKFTERVDNLIRLETEDGRLLTVPIEKLSVFDQKYLESAKPAMEENPFAGGEKIDKSKSGGNSTGGNSAEKNSDDPLASLNTVIPNLNAGKKLILISSGDWNVIPDSEVSSDASPSPFEHGSAGFEDSVHNSLKGLVFSPDKKYAAIAITNAFKKVSGVEFHDIENGKKLSSVSVPYKNASLVGMISSPPTFATTRAKWFKDMGRIDFWDGSSGLSHVIGWEAEYRFAKLLNDKQLFTIDSKGQAVVWDWRNAKAQYYFQAHAHAKPALSANGKQVAVAVSTGIMIIDLATGKPLGTLSTKDRVTGLAFSRDGSKMASVQNAKLTTWDLTTGKLIDSFAVDGVNHFTSSLAWVDEENILVNGTTLVSSRLRVPVWSYNVVGGTRNLQPAGDGQFWYATGGRGKGTVIPVKIPQQEVLDVAANYDPEDFLVIKPGMKISIRMNLPFAQPEQQKIYDSLAAKIKANGCEVDPNSPIVLNCFTERGKTQTREYESRGGFGRPFGRGGSEKVTFTPTICNMQIGKGSDIYWKIAVSTGPGMMMFLNDGESAQQAASKQSKPSARFFSSAPIPKLYAKLPSGKKALGTSELTANGIR